MTNALVVGLALVCLGVSASAVKLGGVVHEYVLAA